MITVNLMGGLGNQLFQIFTTIAYALRYNREFKFEYSDILTTGHHRPTYWNNFLLKLKQYTVQSKINLPLYHEPFFHYKTIPQSFDNVKLFGYFQSPKYFNDKYNEIAEIIDLKNQQLLIKDKYKNYFEKPVISMHFRIGDYKDKQEFHNVLTLKYYENAIKKIIEITNKTDWNILYVCEKDDNEIVSKNIQQLINIFPEIQFIKATDNSADWEQMLSMSLCDHNIIANSTFSWWAAYFNKNEYKIVCYPNQWFGPKLNLNTIDLFIESWKKINI